MRGGSNCRYNFLREINEFEIIPHGINMLTKILIKKIEFNGDSSDDMETIVIKI